MRSPPDKSMRRNVGLTLEPEHFGTRAFLLDVNDVACLVDRSVGFFLLRLDLRELLVQTFELCFCLGDVGLEGFDLIAIGGTLSTLWPGGQWPHAPLLRNRSLEFVEIILVRVLDLVDVGLLLLEQTGYFLILLAEFWKKVLCLFDDTCEIGRIL